MPRQKYSPRYIDVSAAGVTVLVIILLCGFWAILNLTENRVHHHLRPPVENHLGVPS